MRSPCVSHPITEPQIDDNYEFLCRLWSPVVGAEEGGLSTVVARGFQRVKNGALDSDFMFVNIEPYKSKKSVPY